ncbi:MAG: hypothetical protein AMJ62_15965 [Myxococcales bacterium SG8_38]|nr:MAG: hypothetical protein AMJ62_15965 [Myxococcales bacterium SG8_38]
MLSRPLGPTTGRYWVGHFDGARFAMADDEPLAGRVFDGGADFYAATSYNGLSTDEQIWIGWHASWAYAFSIPTEPWRGTMSVPRLLGLVEDGERVVLTQTPYGVEAGREACALVDLSDEPTLSSVHEALASASGDVLDIEIGIRIPAGRGGLAVRVSEDGEPIATQGFHSRRQPSRQAVATGGSHQPKWRTSTLEASTRTTDRLSWARIPA